MGFVSRRFLAALSALLRAECFALKGMSIEFLPLGKIFPTVLAVLSMTVVFFVEMSRLMAFVTFPQLTVTTREMLCMLFRSEHFGTAIALLFPYICVENSFIQYIMILTASLFTFVLIKSLFRNAV